MGEFMKKVVFVLIIILTLIGVFVYKDDKVDKMLKEEYTSKYKINDLYNSKENKNEIVFMYGPLVLAGALGKENFPETDILEDHLKLNHHSGINVPKLVGDIDEISSCITKINEKELIFESKAIGQPENVKVKLIPFYKVTHERYTIYWSVMSEKEYKNIEELENDIIEYIEYYNNRRIKSKLKGMSPVQYREHSELVA